MKFDTFPLHTFYLSIEFDRHAENRSPLEREQLPVGSSERFLRIQAIHGPPFTQEEAAFISGQLLQYADVHPVMHAVRVRNDLDESKCIYISFYGEVKNDMKVLTEMKAFLRHVLKAASVETQFFRPPIRTILLSRLSPDSTWQAGYYTSFRLTGVIIAGPHLDDGIDQYTLNDMQWSLNQYFIDRGITVSIVPHGPRAFTVHYLGYIEHRFLEDIESMLETTFQRFLHAETRMTQI